MQLGFVSAILPDLSLEEVLEFAAETGYDCVEVMCWPLGKAERRYAGVTHIDVTDFSDADAEHIRKLCKETGVSISALGYYPNALSPDEDEAATSGRPYRARHTRRQRPRHQPGNDIRWTRLDTLGR